jgi:CheY-like chemotaxis protein
MHEQPDGGSPSEAATVPASEPAWSPDLEEMVAWLDCEGSSPPRAFRAVEALLRSVGSRRGDLFLILRHLEKVDGSLTGFILGLEAILRHSPAPVILGDPSGVAPLVLSCLENDPRLRLAPRTERARRILIIDPSPAPAAILRTVLGMFGHACTLVHSAVDARRQVPFEAYDLVLLDLEFPKMQSFAIAQILVSQRSPAVLIGLTEREDVWNPENSRRYGFRRILSKPYSALEILEMASGARRIPAV